MQTERKQIEQHFGAGGRGGRRGKRRERRGGEKPLSLALSAKLRNPPARGLAAAERQRPAPSPTDQWESGAGRSESRSANRVSGAWRRGRGRSPRALHPGAISPESPPLLALGWAHFSRSRSGPSDNPETLRDASAPCSTHCPRCGLAAMATKIDKEACRTAYNLVRDDGSDVIW